MNKKISYIVSSLFLFVLPFITFSKDGVDGSSGSVSSGIQNPLKNISSIPDFVNVLLGYVVKAGAVVAVCAFIYSGYLFVKARGNDTELSKAKTVFYSTVIGVAVLLGAQLIASILVGTIKNIQK
jgi:hypothetical protein